MDHLGRPAEFDVDAPHLVLEELAKRLDEPKLHRLGQAADVVVRLDDVRLAGLAAGRLDQVGLTVRFRLSRECGDLRLPS